MSSGDAIRKKRGRTTSGLLIPGRLKVFPIPLLSISNSRCAIEYADTEITHREVRHKFKEALPKTSPQRFWIPVFLRSRRHSKEDRVKLPCPTINRFAGKDTVEDVALSDQPFVVTPQEVRFVIADVHGVHVLKS